MKSALASAAKSAAAFLVLFCLCAPAHAQPKYVGWSMAYYPGWDQEDLTPDKINWKAITHLAHFALIPGPNGTLNPDANDLQEPFIKDAVAEAHKHNVKILISIGGENAGTALEDACSPANIHTFVKNLLAFMRKYGYDGIDTDWEDGFNDAEFLAWHKELRDSINKISPRPLLTIAGGGYFAEHCARAWPYVDQMNDMCYDLKYNHLTARLKQFTDQGVPKSILGVGIGIGNDPTEGNGEMVDGTAADWDGKVNWAISNGMGGIMQWEVMDNALVAACYTHLQQYINPNGTPVRPAAGARPSRRAPSIRIALNEKTGVREISYTAASSSIGIGPWEEWNRFDVKGGFLGRRTRANLIPSAKQ
ncbi:MAG: chitinase [Fibrobacteres bacterium]|nr:chitinase [Fibrobacterota bacterium]